MKLFNSIWKQHRIGRMTHKNVVTSSTKSNIISSCNTAFDYIFSLRIFTSTHYKLMNVELWHISHTIFINKFIIKRRNYPRFWSISVVLFRKQENHHDKAKF